MSWHHSSDVGASGNAKHSVPHVFSSVASGSLVGLDGSLVGSEVGSLVGLEGSLVGSELGSSGGSALSDSCARMTK